MKVPVFSAVVFFTVLSVLYIYMIVVLRHSESTEKPLPKPIKHLIRTSNIDTDEHVMDEHDADEHDVRRMKDTEPTSLNDVFISITTTGQYHYLRLPPVLDTWWLLARNVTYIFSDADDTKLTEITRGHFTNTGCPKSRKRGLCCKTSVEYDAFISSGKRWFCHVDDDNYVNIPALVQLLQKYNHTEDWYLGRLTINHPMEYEDPNNPGHKTHYLFAHGGAGYCISHGLATKMKPYITNRRLEDVFRKLHLGEDASVGFVITHELKANLTVIKDFHSHYEQLTYVPVTNSTITLSHSGGRNIVNIDGFPHEKDPSRFLSIHCKLNPGWRNCPAQQQKLQKQV